MNPLLLPERALKFSMIPSILAGLKTERKKSPTVIRKLFIVFSNSLLLKKNTTLYTIKTFNTPSGLPLLAHLNTR